MSTTWKHWVVAAALVGAGSLGFADEANAVSPVQTTTESRVSTPQGYPAVASEGPSRAAFRAAVLPEKQEPFRACVKHRESRGKYDAQNPRSSAQGAYQFLDSQWRDSLAHMVKAEIKEHGQPRPGLLAHLKGTPIKDWEPIYQDVAFATVLNARGPWSGAKHWHLTGSKCSRLIWG